MSDRAVDLTGAWSGVALFAICTVGLVLLGGLIPPPDPDQTAEQIAAWYSENLGSIRVATCMLMVGLVLVGPVCLAITHRLRRAEGGSIFLSNVLIAAIGASIFGSLLIATLWAAAAFRPGETSPEVTQMLNDLAWFLVVWGLSPFVMIMVTVSVSILMTPDPGPFPRWSGYLSIWAALVLIPGVAVLFFKTGPLAYNGLVGFYVPVIGFFVWLAAMVILLFKDDPS